ncbi:hypothetical protein LV164_007917 [Aspergillus fumigatus]|nr:hypothetical protein KXX57_007632 [Aspergillus fumigatus]KAH1981436.1 hypothetical protein KXW88_005860 [Aspergillus fumigatus]KAH2672574.1 hypothetical protein KXV32_000358 [Aspergillus fumigatus]KAH2760678.1 hypothetical protein KXV94_007224 [Aspergillus fumigatus]KAH2921528.1 hypothetical protein KXW25_001635 [Aspergillus fumigatus]
MPIFPASPLQPIKNGWHIFSDLVCNKLTEGAEKLLRAHMGADLFIVTGSAGVGKSSFIKEITGEDVYIGSTLESGEGCYCCRTYEDTKHISGTKITSLVPTVIGNQRCLFLDMPGFNTRDFDDWDIFHRLMTAMFVVERYVQFRGVLYVDSMEENRVTPATEKILTGLWLFCGQDYMPNVTHDASIYHHGLVIEGENYRTLHIERQAERRRVLARDAITALYEHPTSLKLQIYTEIANGATIDTTLAGRWLKYGRAAHDSHDSQDNDETRADSSPGDGSTRSEQQGERQQRDGANRPNEFAAKAAAWAEQFSDTWEDIKPWARLLYKAARFYGSWSSRSSPSGFDYFADDASENIFFDDFDFPEEPFSGPEEASGWACVIL